MRHTSSYHQFFYRLFIREMTIPDFPALSLETPTGDRNIYSYQEFMQRVKTLAYYFKMHGAAANENAVLIYPMGFELCAAVYACMYSGVAPIIFTAPHEENTMRILNKVIHQTGARYIILPSQQAWLYQWHFLSRPIFQYMHLDKVMPDSVANFYQMEPLAVEKRYIICTDQVCTQEDIEPPLLVRPSPIAYRKLLWSGGQQFSIKPVLFDDILLANFVDNFI